MKTPLENLCYAISVNDVELAEYMLGQLSAKAIHDCRMNDREQSTLLHYAIRMAMVHKDDTLLTVLLKNPAICELLAVADDNGAIPASLLNVVKNPQWLNLLLLLVKAAAPGSPWLNQSINLGCAMNWIFTKSLLVDDVERVTTHQWPPLAIAIYLESTLLIDALYEKECDLSTVFQNISLLAFAVGLGALAQVTRMLLQGTPVTPIALADGKRRLDMSRTYYQEILTALLNAVTDPNSYPPLLAPLVLACQLQDRTLIKNLLAKGAKVDVVTDKGSLLHLLCTEGLVDALEEILESANKEKLTAMLALTDEKGQSVLQVACLYADKTVRKRMVELLLNKGAEPSVLVLFAREKVGETPALYEDVELVELLLKNYPDLSRTGAPDHLLHLLLRNANQKIAEVLIRRGASFLCDLSGDFGVRATAISGDSTLLLLQIYCENFPADRLHEAYKSEEGSTTNGKMYYGPANANGFDKLIKNHLSFLSIHHYLEGKAEERGEANQRRYRQRLQHFANLLMSLSQFFADSQAFADNAYGIIANMPTFETGGLSLGSWVLSESQDRYRGLVQHLLTVPMSVLRQRLQEEINFIKNAQRTNYDAGTWHVIADLRTQMNNPTIIAPITVPVNGDVNEIAFAIKSHDSEHLLYLLREVKTTHPLWTVPIDADGETVLNFALRCALTYDDARVFTLLLTQLASIAPMQLAQLLQSNKSLVEFVRASTAKQKHQLLEALIKAAEAVNVISIEHLVAACEIGYLPVIETALGNTAFSADDWELLLITAISHGKLDIITLLLNRDVPIPVAKAFLEIDYNGGLTENNRQILILLLSRLPEAELNTKMGADQDTPLMIACTIKAETEVRALMAKGADVVKSITGSTPIHRAVYRGASIDLCRDLLGSLQATEESLVMHFSVEKTGNTLLHLACYRQENNCHDSLEMLTLLANTADLGLSINRCNSEGLSALHVACQLKQTEVIEFLVTRLNADINVVNNNTLTPLGHVSALAVKDASYLPIIQQLLALGATKVNNEADSSLLKWACENKHWDLVRTVLCWESGQAMVRQLNVVKLGEVTDFPVDIITQLFAYGPLITVDAIGNPEKKLISFTTRVFQQLNADTPESNQLRKNMVAAFQGPYHHRFIQYLIGTMNASNFPQFQQLILLFLQEGQPLHLLKRNLSTLLQNTGRLLSSSRSDAVHLLFWVPLDGTLAQLHFLCKQLPSVELERLWYGSEPFSPLSSLPKEYDERIGCLCRLTSEVEAALCFQDIHRYLAQKSVKTDVNEQRRYQERLHDFAKLIVDLRELAAAGPAHFMQNVGTRLAVLPELETRRVTFLGASVSVSKEQYRDRFEFLGKVDVVMLYRKFTEYSQYLQTFSATSTAEPAVRGMVEALNGAIGRLEQERVAAAQAAVATASPSAGSGSVLSDSQNLKRV